MYIRLVWSEVPDTQLTTTTVHQLGPVMATFSKVSFNIASYASSRPTYPQSLFNFIFDFHRRSPDGSGNGAGTSAQWERAVDLGCGTGEK